MIAVKPAIRHFLAIVVDGLVLLVQPEPICLHCSVLCSGPGMKLLLEIKRPRLLPDIKMHFHGGAGFLHLAQPRFKASIRHCQNPLIHSLGRDGA